VEVGLSEDESSIDEIAILAEEFRVASTLKIFPGKL